MARPVRGGVEHANERKPRAHGVGGLRLRPGERDGSPWGCQTSTSARRSVSRVLSLPADGGSGMAIHLGPPVARRLMRPTRGLGSAPLPRAGRPPSGCALLFGLAPGGVCRVSLRSPTRRPAAGIVTVALVLALRRTGVTRHPALGSSDFPHAAGSPRRRAAIRPPR